MGKKYKQRWHGIHQGEEPRNYPLPSAPGCKVQVVRSVSDWSHGVLTEHSIQNACESLSEMNIWSELTLAGDIRLIREADHFIYIGTPPPFPVRLFCLILSSENQFLYVLSETQPISG